MLMNLSLVSLSMLDTVKHREKRTIFFENGKIVKVPKWFKEA